MILTRPERADSDCDDDHARTDPAAVFDVIDLYERVEVPALGETLTVVDLLGVYGSPGCVLKGERFRYLLAVDGDGFRLERWSGITYRRVLEADRIERDAAGRWTIPREASTVVREGAEAGVVREVA